ncbi:MAG: DUF975 family protein [Bacteroidales bacterium]|nr:DUF975 family protein [Bacteroidales bacterium]
MGKINDLKNEALASLRGKWGSFVGLTFIYVLLYVVAQAFAQFGTIFQGSTFTTLTYIFMSVGFVVSILLIPLQYGYCIAYLNSSRQDLPADIGDLFCGYRRFIDVFVTVLLQGLAIAGAMLLSIIFIAVAVGLGLMESHVVLFTFIAAVLMIPGFVLAIAYAMVFFILHDKPELRPVDVLRESRKMMNGHKMEFFLLMLSFFGWMVLAVLTLFIGLLWLAPYMQMTEFKFYERLRAEYEGVPEEEMPASDEMPLQEAFPQEEEPVELSE